MEGPRKDKNPILIVLAVMIAIPGMFLGKGHLHPQGGNSSVLAMLAAALFIAAFIWAMYYLKKK